MVNFYGYSWAIIACWTVMAFMIFNHLPTLSLPRWKLMFLNTSICIVVIGIVSTLHPETGSLILPETGGYLGVILGKTSLHVASFRAFGILAISAFFVSRTIRRKSEEAAFAGVLFGFTSAPLVAGFIFSNVKHSTKNGCSYLFQTFNKFSRDARIQQKLNSITKNLVTLTKGQQVGTIETSEVRTECTPNTAQVDSFGTNHASPWRSSNDWVNDIDKQRVSENSLWEIPPMEVLEKTRPADVISETFFETGDIIKNALDQIIKIQSNHDKIKAIIGPCLHVDNFEISTDFRANFLKINSNYKDYFDINYKNNKIHFNLKNLIKFQLKENKIFNIEEINIDTYSNEDLFFSHRRSTHLNKLPTGRMINIMGFKN